MMRRWLLALCLLLLTAWPAMAINLLDAVPWDPTLNIPTAPGCGGKYVDNYTGNRVLQVTCASNGGNGNHDYSNRPSFNNPGGGAESNAVLIRRGAGNTWTILDFDPAAFTVTATARCTMPSNVSTAVGLSWDWSGNRPYVIYYVVNDTTDANRIIREVDGTVGGGGVCPSSTVKLTSGATATHADYSTALHILGTVTSSTDAANFVSGIVEPITDLSPEWFNTQQLVWTSGVNDTKKAIITTFNHTTGAFVIAACTPTACVGPAAGDAFYVRPAGFNSEWQASWDGIWIMGSVGTAAGGGQDNGRVAIAFNRATDTLYTVYVTAAILPTSGYHGSSPDYLAGTNNTLVFGWGDQSIVVWNPITGAVTPARHNPPTTIVSHSSGSTGFQFEIDGQTPGGYGTRSYANPNANTGNPVNLWNRVKKQGKHTPNSNAHISTTHHPAMGTTSFVASQYNGAGATGMVADTCGGGATCYRLDNYLTNTGLLCNLRCLDPTPANQGAAWVNGFAVTYMGTTSASVVAAGQWAYDPTGSGGKGQAWVRGNANENLTVTSNKFELYDRRPGQDEIWRGYYNPDLVTACAAGTCNWYRIALSYHRDFADPSGCCDGAPRANSSRNGRYVIFSSTLTSAIGAKRRDEFIVDTYRGQAALVTPAALVGPAPLVSPASGITASTVVTVPR